MARVSVLVFVLVLLVAPVALPRCFSGVTLNGLLCVDALEDTAFLHCEQLSDRARALAQ